MSATLPTIGLGVITYNSRRHIDRCLDSIRTATEGLEADCLVVDNNSSDGTGDYLTEAYAGSMFRILCRPDNVGYAGGVNTIARVVSGEVLVICNPDLELEPDALHVALAYLATHPEVGLLGGNLLNPTGDSQLVYGALPTPFRLFYAFAGLRRLWANPAWDIGRGIAATVTEPFEVGYPCGALWFIRRTAWEEIGPFDERYFLYFEETDWATRCHQTRWQVRVHPGVRAMHEGAGSSEKDQAAQIVVHTRFFRSAFQYLAKHFGVAASRRTFNALAVATRLKQGLLKLGMPERIQRSQKIIRTGLLNNREFVMSEALVADPAPVLREPLPGESAVRSAQA